MARRFKFNLETVLRYRGVLEDQRQREFAEASRELEEERLRREEFLRERGKIQDEIVAAYRERAPFHFIVESYRLAGGLERSAEESAKIQRRLAAEMEKRRQALIAARRDKRVMETLKERRREEFVRERERQEQTLLDEMSIQARGRRLREEALPAAPTLTDSSTGSSA
ncbi:MAG: flagellar export protein FliJ [Planctomycetota bacterium]|jgi:flagellar FliJ protein|nr:flagellar export protein FliJ [Planctomycetota bacterium]